MIVDVARSLQVPKIQIVLNNTSEALDIMSAHSQLEQTYQCGKGIILPHTEELMALSSNQLFAASFPRTSPNK